MSILLEANKVMTLVASDVTAGAYWVIGNPGDEPSGYTPIAAGVTAIVGPFKVNKNYEAIDLTATIANFEVLDEDDMVSDTPNSVPSQQSVKAYVDDVQDGLIADGVTAWQSGIESDIDALQADDVLTIHTSNDVSDLTPLGSTNIVNIGNSATGTEIATAVNGILAILLASGLMDAAV